MGLKALLSKDFQTKICFELRLRGTPQGFQMNLWIKQIEEIEQIQKKQANKK